MSFPVMELSGGAEINIDNNEREHELRSRVAALGRSHGTHSGPSRVPGPHVRDERGILALHPPTLPRPPYRNLLGQKIYHFYRAPVIAYTLLLNGNCYFIASPLFDST